MKLGIIGGSGLYEIDGVSGIAAQKISTPFGEPSGEFITGHHGGGELVFLARHGKGHTIMPSEINFKANIYAMKTLGVTHILSISAVGSLRDDVRPRDVVIPDQYFDRTKAPAEQHTFFGGGIVGHIGFGHPVCPELAELAARAAEAAAAESEDPDRRVHRGGTYVNMAGPAFSTKAESNFYRQIGAAVVGMTNLAEAKLAREAEICYATVAMVTDFDCWHPDHDHVTVDLIIGHLIANTALGKTLILKTAEQFGELSRACPCPNALDHAIITAPDAITPALKKKLAPIIGKYIK
jgi:5'-methylthioadenosine phosphorylase